MPTPQIIDANVVPASSRPAAIRRLKHDHIRRSGQWVAATTPVSKLIGSLEGIADVLGVGYMRPTTHILSNQPNAQMGKYRLGDVGQ
ncbi:hypothetical protein OPT61_g8232 [Boeremia exigua]|uniref:Uncharacterized protein n=1 Tax=Boeremia exigua TaxID=749465 RepID=A0ACC2HZ21_9PLEO|nr:hypothetical protein OPT61_g8232 [Boeremia exigua]